MATTTVALSTKEIKELVKTERQEKYLERIKEANNRWCQDECESLDLTVSTPPKQKTHVHIEDDSHPFLTKDYLLFIPCQV